MNKMLVILERRKSLGKQMLVLFKNYQGLHFQLGLYFQNGLLLQEIMQIKLKELDRLQVSFYYYCISFDDLYEMTR